MWSRCGHVLRLVGRRRARAVSFAVPLRSPALGDLCYLACDSGSCEFDASVLAAGAPSAAAKAASGCLRSRNRHKSPAAPSCSRPQGHSQAPTVSRLTRELCISRCRGLCRRPEPVAAVGSILPLDFPPQSCDYAGRRLPNEALNVSNHASFETWVLRAGCRHYRRLFFRLPLALLLALPLSVQAR